MMDLWWGWLESFPVTEFDGTVKDHGFNRGH